MSERSFEIKYLEAIHALHELDSALIPIGMSDCRELYLLRKAVIAHGAETFEDITHNQ